MEYNDEGSLLRPLRALSFLGRPAVTEPLEPRLAAEGYRGFHLNQHAQCVGCSSCQKICDNAAITMVEVVDLPSDAEKGIRNLRPAIDYGRCCWCALCVDICPTGSLNLSREYVHTCSQEQIDSYFILPDETGMHGTFYGKGWQKTESSDLLALERQPMGEMEPVARGDNFAEIVEGFTPQQALAEASRCVQCGMCHDACPTQMDAPQYIRSIYEGDLEQAVRWIYQSNPFSHVCGRVCTHRCEDACSIGVRGTPLAIRWLKRYAMDGVAHERIKEIAQEGRVTTSSGKQVAVVGAGPAGLTAAWDLARMGHKVVVFESRERPGGMPRYGIPEYRLPYEMLDRDIEVITAMGVEIRCGVEIGRQITMDQLHAEYDAVVLAIGLHLGRSTRIPGSQHEQVCSAVELLRKVTEAGSFEVPREVVVIGGGNVAMDIARTVGRLQRQQWGEVKVVVTALEAQENFLADPEEIREAIEEGVAICPSRGPQACVVEGGALQSLKTWGVCSIFDEQGRFAPHYDEGDEQCHPAGMIIEAIGQMSDAPELLGERLTEVLEWSRGRLQVCESGRTSEPWLWAAGDCVNGPDVVHAVADGHRVAASIDEVLSDA
jgi:glutamate synthase (NADPH/NADH) small chain